MAYHVHRLLSLALSHKQHPTVLPLVVQIYAGAVGRHVEHVRHGQHGGAYQIIVGGDILIIYIYLK